MSQADGCGPQGRAGRLVLIRSKANPELFIFFSLIDWVIKVMAKGVLQWWKLGRRGLYGDMLQVLHVASLPGWCALSLTFTSVPGFDVSRLLPAHRDLMRRLEVSWELTPEYIGVRTSEGNGVLHVFWLFHRENVFIPVQWLWGEWRKLTGAQVVRVRACGRGEADVLKMSRYGAGQPLFVRSFRSVGLDAFLELAKVLAG